MESKQKLLSSLTAHISLYHSQLPTRNSNSSPSLNHRPAILRWFSSLSVHQRCAHLTTVSPHFIAILVQMHEKLQSYGSGRFIILPDLPQNEGSALPTLCYTKSEGLLLRFSEFNTAQREIREAVRLFSSREGEGNGDSIRAARCLDAMCLREGLVGDVDRFVEVMDAITNGEFLRGGQEAEMVGEWVELEWLKAKGHYSLEEFVVNRVEVALRLAWLNSNTGKKRGVKLKNSLNGAAMAANLFWRKKGCVDWWEKLDASLKKKVFNTYLGKAAKLLTIDILKGKENVLEGTLWRSCYEGEQPLRCSLTALGRRNASVFKGTPSKIKWNSGPTQVSGNISPLDSLFNSLSVLQVISTIILASQHGGCDRDELFFSSLDSVNSISDIISRKFRELIRVISLDCTKFELLGDGNRNSCAEKLNVKHVDKRKKRGKNRNKKSNASANPNHDPKPSEPTEGKGDESCCKKDVRLTDKLGCKVQEKDLGQRGHLSEANEGVSNGKLRSARKSKKERKKLKSFISDIPEVGSCKSSSTGASSACTSSQQKPLIDDWTSGGSTPGNLWNQIKIVNDRLDPNESIHSNLNSHVIRQQANIDSSMESNCYDSCDVTKCGDQGAGHNCLDNFVDPLGTTVKPVGGYIDDDLNNVADRENHADPNKMHGKTGYSGKHTKGGEPVGKPSFVQEQGSVGILRVGAINSPSYMSYEWPSVAPIHPSGNTHLPAATDRLHLDVGHNWQNHFHHSVVQTLQVRNSPFDSGYNGIIPRPLPMSLDWPPVVRGGNILVPSVTCNYDPEFISRRQSSLQQGFTPQILQCGRATSEDERTISGEFVDFPDVTNSQDPVDEHDKHWMSEEDSEVHAASGMDYNQYFGGGVMYWNPSDRPGTSFSRPPSLCSDDSSWAWREADMNRAIDDMVAFSSSYSTTGLTSPSAASFCSPFDPLGSGALGFVMPGSEISSKVLHPSATMADVVPEESISASISNISSDGEVKAVDSLPYPILRPIIIPSMVRERSRSDFSRNYDHKSPCIPPNRREQPRIKRPPSPVVLCVPRAPRPPPPSPAGDSQKHRGFPPVRSGSSSPRHWGVKGWFQEGVNFEEACIPLDGSELVWPSWRSKSVSARQLSQPLAGTLLQDRLIAISQLARDQEHPDVAFPLQPPELQNSSSCKASLSLVHDILHNEIDTFCKQVAAENLIRKPYINWAVKRVARSLQVLWPRSRTNVFGSNATGLSLPSSDVDLVICLPPVRNLEPIKEAGILEGRNGIKETCLQHAARYLANQEWVKSDSLKIVENTAIPIIMLVVEVPDCFISSPMPNVQTPKEEADKVASEQGRSVQTDTASSESSTSPKWNKITDDTNDGVKAVRLDISFKSPTHTGLQTTGLVKDLVERFPAVMPLALVLKQFLADRSLDQSYSGGLSSYCLILLITRFLQHEHHHGRPTNQNYGNLLMDFLYFFGNVFDPRQMRVSVQGTGVYLTRERGCSIDPLYIDDPLFLTNNVGKNCFRVHQCIKAFADAYAVLENEVVCLPDDNQKDANLACKLLPKIIPSIGHLVGP